MNSNKTGKSELDSSKSIPCSGLRGVFTGLSKPTTKEIVESKVQAQGSGNSLDGRFSWPIQMVQPEMEALKHGSSYEKALSCANQLLIRHYLTPIVQIVSRSSPRQNQGLKIQIQYTSYNL
ncbi:unnamed protein product [Ilex paraguariensis]|uniref:Uncharacterized protein n=1 Tax=Ilex paraguariensis TaxID=185542 RepID=A0ABC8V1M6_9AQUA